MRTVTEGGRRVTTIIGPARAGKTDRLRAVGRSLGYAHRDALVLCLSATAADVAAEETGLTARTIASSRSGGGPSRTVT